VQLTLSVLESLARLPVSEREAILDPDSRFQGLRPLRQPVWRETVKEWAEYGAEEVKVKFKPSRDQIGVNVNIHWLCRRCAPSRLPPALHPLAK
jgi:hypothetical protein